MRERKALSTLSREEFQQALAWACTGHLDEEGDPLVVRCPLIDGEVIPRSVGEVWCYCEVRFNNGNSYSGAAMCRGDSDDGARLLSVWNGQEWVSLLFSPAPAFVLEKEGPIPFARSFGLAISDVFPMDVEVIARFELAPRVRKARLNQDGVDLLQ